MPRCIGLAERKVIYNVFLYFKQEAVRFHKIEGGYFQKVQARVAKACCVSTRFLQGLLRDIHGATRKRRKVIDVPSSCKKDVVIKKQTSAAATLLKAPLTKTSPPPLLPLAIKLVPKQTDIILLTPAITPLQPQILLLKPAINPLKRKLVILKPELSPLKPIKQETPLIIQLLPPLPPLKPATRVVQDQEPVASTSSQQVPDTIPTLYKKPEHLPTSFPKIYSRCASVTTERMETSSSDFEFGVTVKCEAISDSDEINYE